MGDLGSFPGLGRSPEGERLPTPVFWPREFHGMYSPWGCKELDTTEQLSLHSIKCKHMESIPTLKVKMLVTQSCPPLCDPMDCSLSGSSAHGDSPGKKTEVGCHAPLQGLLPTQGLNLCLSQPPAIATGFFTARATL